MEQDWETARQTFRQVWGYEDFRPPQGEVVANLLQRQDSLVVMATGGGKSICFQLPALLNQGLTLVISPLLALMQDQVQDLQQRRLPAATLNSNMTTAERRTVLQQLNRLRLLYVSPETLFSAALWERLCAPDLAIAGLMIDEAHCLVEWGDAFRPAYRRLGTARSALMRHKHSSSNLPSNLPNNLRNSPSSNRIAVAAFTATADLRTQTELKSCLELQDPQVIRSSPYRANLSLNVAIAWTANGRREQCLKFIQAHSQESGLIYTRSRRDSEEVAAWLQSKSLETAAYHAGLPVAMRRQIEQKWLQGDYKFVVSTSAFGLGINNAATRWVLHFQPPLTLSEYIQEVGRAGRDGNPAKALMLVSEPTGWLDNSDRQRQDFFMQQQQKILVKARNILPQLPRQGNVTEVNRTLPDSAIALGLLHAAGELVWQDPFNYKILNTDPVLPEVDCTPLEQMQDYINTRSCRWAFLMQCFGFVNTKEWRCGICDRCHRSN